jgi:hypothetical protein
MLRRAGQGKAYQVFGGDGSLGQGWPSSNDWLSFADLWYVANSSLPKTMLTLLRALNLPTLEASCTQYKGSPPNNNQNEINNIKSALESTSKTTGLDSRFLLAVMMQESKGCVRAPTTSYGETNPGLFQSFNGLGSCNPDNVNFVVECPKKDIDLMVQEGAGVNLDFGLQQAIAQSGASDDSKYYKGARIYNSGSIAASGNLGDGIATHCYSSDIANRLVGWPSDQGRPSSCEEASIGSVQGSTSYSGGNTGNTNNNNNNNNNEQPTQEPPQQEANTPQPEDQPETPAPTETPTPSNNDASAPKIEGASPNCKSWYTVKEGDHCSNLSVSFDTLRQLNSKLDDKCSNLWKGYAYCIAA